MASIPDTPNAVVTANSDDDVTFTWAAPSDNGGLSITKYMLKIKGSDGSYTEDSTNCAEANHLTCTVPMTVLTASPYSLSEGDLIVA